VTLANVGKVATVCIAVLVISCGNAPANLLTFGEPTVVSRVCVRAAGGRVLWDIEAMDKSGKVSLVKYSQVPAGFRQVAPENVPPRQLVEGEPLSVLIVSSRGLVCHRGSARSPDGIREGVWHTIPFDHPKNPKADKAFAENLACVP